VPSAPKPLPQPEPPPTGPLPLESDDLATVGSRLRGVLDQHSEAEAAEATKARIAQSLGSRLENDEAFRDFAARRLGQASLDQFSAAEVTQAIEERAASLVSKWAGTSSDGDVLAIQLQMAVRDEFGLGGAYMGHVPQDVMARAAAAYGEDGAALRSFVRHMYADTQKFLEAIPGDTVMLYRGSGWSELPETLKAAFPNGTKVAEKLLPNLQPASSYSVDIQEAINFAQRRGPHQLLMFEEVQKKDILATAQSGFGCKREGEMVVLGNREPVRSFGILADGMSEQGGMGRANFDPLQAFSEAMKR
jgi:hypothetical protein